MRLEEAWDLFKKHGEKTCGTYKLWVTLKQPTSCGMREGWIYEEPGDDERRLEIDDWNDLNIEVEEVYCPYCCEIIYRSDERGEEKW
jgi:hypothetical protein